MLEVAAKWRWTRAGPGVWDTPDGEGRVGGDGWRAVVGAAEVGWQRRLWAQEPAQRPEKEAALPACWGP